LRVVKPEEKASVGLKGESSREAGGSPTLEGFKGKTLDSLKEVALPAIPEASNDFLEPDSDEPVSPVSESLGPAPAERKHSPSPEKRETTPEAPDPPPSEPVFLHRPHARYIGDTRTVLTPTPIDEDSEDESKKEELEVAMSDHSRAVEEASGVEPAKTPP